ncbi:MAG: FMN-binding protein [bacterium]|nr:FMN-binding protein [bacterium]
MKKTFSEIIKPVLVLTLICAVVTFALAYVNSVTAPIIAKSQEEEAQKARAEVLKDGDTFTKIDVDNLPQTVTEVYRAENGAGYVFMLTAKGYGGDMKLICGINSSGEIEECKTLSHNETSGLGSKTAEDPYRSQYSGKTADTLNQVDAITGATISSNAYKNAVTDALEAYKTVKEAE